MSNQQRREDKKRRRQKRLQKRGSRETATETIDDLIETLKYHDVPLPATWPGAADASVSQPDLVKFAFFEHALHKSPGREKLKVFLTGLEKGPLQQVPEISEWGWEEFAYHGLPGDTWDPMESFLAYSQNRPAPAAHAQLRLWKQARIGMFLIGNVSDDLMSLRAWDAVRMEPEGSPFRAIALNIGGVNLYVKEHGQILLTFMAPWVPAENLYCAMGFSRVLPPELAPLGLEHVALNNAAAACRPLPWHVGRAAAEHHRWQWRDREWHGWLAERLRFPFQALVVMPAGPVVRTILGPMPSTPEQARALGIYFQVAIERGEGIVAGGTAITPIDIASGNRLLMAEYHAYRQWSGPPPAAPTETFWRVR